MNRWNKFYQNIRDPSWPECANEHEFHNLPAAIKKEILSTHNSANYLALSESDIIDNIFSENDYHQSKNYQEFNLTFPVANDFFVFYNETLEGGGIEVGQYFPMILKFLYPNRVFSNCLEWCSGHGVIGFRLLADGVCENLHFLEMHKPAIDACVKTIQHMPDRFIGKVSYTHAATLKNLSKNIKFDLVVSNPPNFPGKFTAKLFDIPRNHLTRITVDKEWQAHQDFFTNIVKHLTKDGVILLQEVYHIDEYAEMISSAGLKIKKMFAIKHQPSPWYLELTHK